MFHAFKQVILLIVMEVNDQFGYAGLKQFHMAQFPYVYCNHHGIHTLDTWIDIHESGNSFTQPSKTVVKQINTIGGFIIITAFTKTRKGFIAQRLFLTSGRMECILVSWIKHILLHLPLHQGYRKCSWHRDSQSFSSQLPRLRQIQSVQFLSYTQTHGLSYIPYQQNPLVILNWIFGLILQRCPIFTAKMV